MATRKSTELAPAAPVTSFPEGIDFSPAIRYVQGPCEGLQLVQVESSTLPGEIEAGDLLRINFDQRDLERDGLYVLQLGRWTGVRRLSRTLQGPKVLDIDTWSTVGPDVSILGYVDMVYTARRATAVRL